MSILEPESVERTAITSPTSDSRMARMSSISGPGQKLPRASTIRFTGLMSCSVGVVICATSFLGLDEEAGCVGLGHQLEHRGRADWLAHALDEVLALEAEHVHGHLA